MPGRAILPSPASAAPSTRTYVSAPIVSYHIHPIGLTCVLDTGSRIVRLPDPSIVSTW